MVDVTSRKDDFDDTLEAAERIYFSIRGQKYEIDLTEEHAREFDEALERFVTAARRVQTQAVVPISRGRGDGRRRSGGSGRDDIPQIRAWALGKGMDVSERGRVKRDIIEAYDA